MAIACPQCGSSELDLVEVLEDERRRVKCETCGHEWIRGEARVVNKTTTSIDDLRKRFPSPEDVKLDAAEHASNLKAEYLAAHPSSTPQAVEFRERYQRIFSREALPDATPGCNICHEPIPQAAGVGSHREIASSRTVAPA